jgi:anaerobic selenocysteine-containing dehydrogenase
VSEVAFGGIPFGEVGEYARLPSATGGPELDPEPPVDVVTPGSTLRLVRYRPLFSGAAVERVPELQFQRAPQEVELSAQDAAARGIRNGADVTVRSNGTSVRLRARVTDELRAGVVRIAEPHAGELAAAVEVSA